MTRLAQHVARDTQSQMESARDDQVRNDAGGFVFGVDKWTRLDRFLILGTEGGTYYVDEKKLTQRNYNALKDCLVEDGVRAVRRIVEISDSGRAPKNDAAIFALAVAAGWKNPVVAQAALAALPKVCRIGTHLFHFAADMTTLAQRGWGRSLRRAVAAWYLDKDPNALAYDVIKYQQRDGWSHHDMLRLSHASAKTAEHNALLRWVACNKTLGDKALDARSLMRKGDKQGSIYGALGREQLPLIIGAFEQIQRSKDVREVCRLIREHRLPHEAVPNEWKNTTEVWDALLDHMGLTAVVRNLGKMTSVGLIEPLSSGTARVCARLNDDAALRKARVHPMAMLLALGVYRNGHGAKGKLAWEPVGPVLDALDAGFYGAFVNVVPTGKRYLLALDVSGSMRVKFEGSDLTVREAAAAMAMVTARTESQHAIIGFTAGATKRGYQLVATMNNAVSPLPISPRQRLDDIVQSISNIPFGNTDCALPMLYAADKSLEVDVAIVFTDSETWAGPVHPFVALEKYRQKTGIKTKFIACAMTATEYSVADPTDPRSMDIVGFDASVPTIIDSFVRDAAVEPKAD